MPQKKSGSHTPLNVTQEANQRVFVGLGWDPVDMVRLVDKIKALAGIKETHHDLDLSCFLYDENRHFIESVGALGAQDTDSSGKIYYSGDNIEGIGEGDDEQISAELKDLPTKIHYIAFVASIKSGHTFSEVSAPEIRLVDAYSNYTLLHKSIADTDSESHSAYLFLSLYRDTQGGWMLHHIGKYFSHEGTTATADYISAQLESRK